jgi:ABC-type multidrug transport system permease subunit
MTARPLTPLYCRYVECSAQELRVFDPPSNQTCGTYMDMYLELAGGQLYNPKDRAAAKTAHVLSCRLCYLMRLDQGSI